MGIVKYYLGELLAEMEGGKPRLEAYQKAHAEAELNVQREIVAKTGKKHDTLQGDPKKVGAGGTAPVTDPFADFRGMPNLTADEITIAFVGEHERPLLSITARNYCKRVGLDTFGLENRSSGGLNQQGLLLRGLVDRSVIPKNNKTSMTVSRLRKLFENNFGITSDPFSKVVNERWEPLFTVESRVGDADERAKNGAERRMVSLDALPELAKETLKKSHPV